MTWALINSDVIAGLRQLPDESVHCCVCSPPYWALRDYGTPAQIWGGDPDCEHEWGQIVVPAANGIQHEGGMSGKTLSGNSATRKPRRSDHCQKCDAWRGSLGLEPTPDLFVRNLVLVFREVRRVLRDDGTLWLDIGDSYANDGKWGGETGGLQAYLPDNDRKRVGREKRHTGLKPKDLIGIPWRLAFALQADGWHLRSDIIWSKPNAMPESVRDRPTKSHEYVLMLTKRRRYFYDAEAVKEPVTGNAHARGSGVNPKAEGPGSNSRMYQDRDPRHSQARKIRQNENWSSATAGLVDSRNRRSVWTIATHPNPEAHFATFPTELPEICIRAGTSEKGCCAKCGASWVRVIKRRATGRRQAMASAWDTGPGAHGSYHPNGRQKHRNTDVPVMIAETIGWRPSCKCEVTSEPVDCVVLDPFAGTSTTGVAAARLGRRFIGIELSKEYCEISERRLREAERQAYGDLFLPLVKEIKQSSLFQLIEMTKESEGES